MAYPWFACVVDEERATRASCSRKPCVNRSSGSKVIPIGSRRGRRKNWLEQILQPTLAQLSLILVESEGSKWLKCCAILHIYSLTSGNFVISRFGPFRAKLLAKVFGFALNISCSQRKYCSDTKNVTPQASTTQLKSEPVELKMITRSIRDGTKTMSKEWKKDITRSQITS
ncbi:hypothetical protein PIB30_060939 [Stylosanthes scabra]|uniref:Uncharacterized protein n=1 Tax=Stylosanthes scabra TaxID=79078 RepID=A0ABU6VNS4_9FABA|nr:hypothetical protein [Stylosanthes scabra]